MGLSEILRDQQASKDAADGAKFLKNSSLEGEAKLINFVQDLQDKYRENPGQFSASVYALKNRPENNKELPGNKGTVGLGGSDSNGNNYLEIPELYTTEATGGIRSCHPMKERAQYENHTSGQGSTLEEAVNNIHARNKAVDQKF